MVDLNQIRLLHEHIYSCFRVRYGESTGTCFIYSDDRGIFLVTAAHVMQGCRKDERICLQRDNGDWRFFVIKDISFAERGIDVCTFSLEDFTIRANPDFHVSELSISLGEQVKFLGFPHGLTNTHPSRGFAVPLVRTAHFSGSAVINGLEIAIFDGFNNPGYSGGPVYVRKEDGSLGVFAVISGYRTEVRSKSKLYRQNPGEAEEEVLGHYVKFNSGMIYTHLAIDIENCARSLEHRNPSLPEN